MTENIIPSYVYAQHKNFDGSLSQGDILKVDGQFRERFLKFYPAIEHPEGVDKYVMILTQSCDLVKNEKRKLKVNHINVCLVRTLKSLIERKILEIKPVNIGGKNLLPKDVLGILQDWFFKLLNNNDQKTHFFLPKKSPFVEDMVAILPLSFSFRIEHYELLLENRVIKLKPEFQAKIGNILSQLYGRVGTDDLSTIPEWDEKQTTTYIDNLLNKLNLQQVPNKSFIDHVKKNYDARNCTISELMQEHEELEIEKSFQPKKREFIHNVRKHLIKLFEEKDKISSLLGMKKKEDLSKELSSILREAVESF